MGTRHQIYVIAQVQGRYRVVYFQHHQSLYPEGAAILAWSILQLVERYEESIAKELQCLEHADYFGTHPETEFPCPYLARLLFQAVCDYNEDDFSRPEGVNNEPDAQDNNSGYTAIDITHPLIPAYCFFDICSTSNLPVGCPVDAETNVTEGYDSKGLDELDEQARTAVLNLQQQCFIEDKGTLDEAWEGWTPREEDDDALSPAAQRLAETLRNAKIVNITENYQYISKDLSPTKETLGALREILRGQTLGEDITPILIHVFLVGHQVNSSAELDLSWLRLSSTQIIRIVEAVTQASPNSSTIVSLDLSGIASITVETLSEIFKLPSASSIDQIFLFGCQHVRHIKPARLALKIGTGEKVKLYTSYFPKDNMEFYQAIKVVSEYVEKRLGDFRI